MIYIAIYLVHIVDKARQEYRNIKRNKTIMKNIDIRYICQNYKKVQPSQQTFNVPNCRETIFLFLVRVVASCHFSSWSYWSCTLSNNAFYEILRMMSLQKGLLI